MVFDAMFLNPPGTDDSRILLVGLPVLGMLVGFALIRRAAGENPDREPSFWRYREVDAIKPAVGRRTLPTIGWVATRVQMALAVAVFGFILVSPMLGIGPAPGSVGVGELAWLAAVGLSAIGAVWIFRIARRSPESGAPSWRYRSR